VQARSPGCTARLSTNGAATRPAGSTRPCTATATTRHDPSRGSMRSCTALEGTVRTVLVTTALDSHSGVTRGITSRTAACR
jgi:hypothetical protein